ncbi:MAG: ribosome small subunit-dependent GTPase A [Mycobacterium leprae]
MIPCILRGRLKREQRLITSLVAVGDRVTVALLPDGTGAIESVEPRTSELSRPGFHGYLHVIAANIDQLVVVAAAIQPRFKLGLVERFLTLAHRGKMQPLVVINKCELEAEATIRSWVAPLEASGVSVLLTSAREGRGLAELRERLAGRISCFAGQSGVGKSSLVNALYGEELARTTAVSDSSQKGRHTTTASRLYALPDGGYLADTPGIRQLALFDDEEQDDAVDEVFPDIVALAGGCKFRDCTHSHEPRCAVKAAVASGALPAVRYRDYLRLHDRQMEG